MTTEFDYGDVCSESLYVIWNNLISNGARLSLQCSVTDKPLTGIIMYYHADNRMITPSDKCVFCLRV